MITFDQARAITAAALLPQWSSLAGTFYVADWGWETDQYWSIPAGASEWLQDGDETFQILDDTVSLVDKQTGQFIQTVAYLNIDFLDQMKPYGDIPKDFLAIPLERQPHGWTIPA